MQSLNLRKLAMVIAGLLSYLGISYWVGTTFANPEISWAMQWAGGMAALGVGVMFAYLIGVTIWLLYHLLLEAVAHFWHWLTT